ncbi:hypothetical protein DFJ74DRAFT_657190 [Hyaloraphidium curvatum]|nr:hypothetical protein DFJ74DRAFT_657190 [Hyaloraphidium curvatum]
MRSWHPLPAKPAADFWPAACSYKFVLIVTAPFDQYHPPINETAAAHWLSCPDGGQRPIIAVMVHIADHFSKPLAARQLAWLRPSYVLGTAPHTADVMRSFGPGKVDYLSSLYPLFPEGWNSTSRRGLGIGGQLDTTRRDYASVFRELETSPPPAGSPALPVRLLGSFGPPHANATIPPALLQNGLVDLPGGGRRVPYGEFFKHFPLARALLPAFKTGAGYTVHTASSVLFNSLVSLTPLAVPAEVLALYSFLDPRAHFNPEDGTVLAAHKAMVGKEGEYGGMLSRLLENRECLMRRNVEVAEAMLRGGEVGLPNECGKGR